MSELSRRRTVLSVVGAVLAVGLISLGAWVVVDRGTGAGTPRPAAPGAGAGGQAPTTPPATEPAWPTVPTAPTAPAGGTAPGSTPAPTMTVRVYFHVEDRLTAVTRTVPRTAQVATAALTQLLAGPTAAERATGITSALSARTAGLLRSVRITGGVGYVDFGDLAAATARPTGSSVGPGVFAEIDATVTQFAGVTSTVYALAGDVEAFYGWVERTAPTTGAATAAYRFATGVLGMVRPVLGRPRSTAAGVVVAAASRHSPGSTSALSTDVSLRRSGFSWTVTGARCGAVGSRSPAPGQRVSSPVRVTAMLKPFMPGEPEVRVVQVTGGQAVLLGRGRLRGQPELLFSADVSYRLPAAGTGWVLVVERAIDTVDGNVAGEPLGGDAIPVRFAQHG